MGGLDDFTIREGDIEWVRSLAFVADGDIGKKEVCGGPRVSNSLIGAQGYIDWVGGGGTGESAGGWVGLGGGYGVGTRGMMWAGGTIAGDDCNVIIIRNRWAR